MSVWSHSSLAHVALVLLEVTVTVVVDGQVQVPWSYWPAPAGGETMTLGAEV